jgi:hypothetical protein
MKRTGRLGRRGGPKDGDDGYDGKTEGPRDLERNTEPVVPVPVEGSKGGM